MRTRGDEGMLSNYDYHLSLIFIRASTNLTAIMKLIMLYLSKCFHMLKILPLFGSCLPADTASNLSKPFCTSLKFLFFHFQINFLPPSLCYEVELLLILPDDITSNKIRIMAVTTSFAST